MDVARVRRLTERLQARARPPLPADLVPLHIAGARVGDVQPEIARLIAGRIDGFTLNNGVLEIADATLDVGARSALLAEAATSLFAAGLITGWRGENLCVGTPPIATIERAACRALGITTEAVHLNAYISANTLVIARRAAHKQIDPGLWDNLVGGMVAAGESLHQALAREAFEEAGLRVDGLDLQRGRWFQMRRPVPEGLQSEVIHVYDTLLPPGISPRNQDGEVDAIELRTLDDVIDAIDNDQFTLEAALVTLESVTRHARIDIATGFFHPYETSSIHAI